MVGQWLMVLILKVATANKGNMLLCTITKYGFCLESWTLAFSNILNVEFKFGENTTYCCRRLKNLNNPNFLA